MYKKLIHNYLLEIVLGFIIFLLFILIIYIVLNVNIHDYKEGILRYEGDDLNLYNIKPSDIKTNEIELNINYDNSLYTYKVVLKEKSVINITIDSETLKYFLHRHNIAEVKVSLKLQDISIFEYIFGL
ncbi:MAG1140 family protein [Mycoplasmopsis verecunda]|uniref:Uncharacterized protein n=1 Tax=Mycoplasmopsis verecunda TaxID=171291 RepID=A0A1T4L1M4_9BACT|nr:hypothetical protein [Mycoplasmopsis verecunda]WPB54385.1 hypothetical protein SAM46_02755 [Mycoplasmopsis verecunda]SJZ48543.1 hypothetical protein SAMN02745154_00291 [Mycoplasmopsis verecunda]